MAGIYKTSRGSTIDLDRLKLINQTSIAVGNAGTNARGDIVQGGKIIKTREQIAQEYYNISGNNVVKDQKVRRSSAAIEPDIAESPAMVEIGDPFQDLQSQETSAVIEQSALPNEPRGGLASAVNRSQEIAERLAAQRRRI